jgi:hypothetical protein
MATDRRGRGNIRRDSCVGEGQDQAGLVDASALRWVVERTFGWITRHRRCVRDYETLPSHHEAMVHIAMIMTMSRRLAHTRNH